MKPSDVLIQIATLIREKLAEHDDAVLTIEGAEAILGLMQAILPEVMTLEAAVEEIVAAKLREQGENVVLLSQRRRALHPAPAQGGGVA